MKPRINQLLKLYQKSWSKAKRAKAMQNKYRKSNKELANVYAAQYAYYVFQWLRLKKVLLTNE